MTSGGHIKLDLIEFIQVIDYVNTKVGLQEGASCIVPVTTGREVRKRLQKNILEQLETIKVAKKGSCVPYFHTH